jgi:Putative zinc-finger/HEAT repeats
MIEHHVEDILPAYVAGDLEQEERTRVDRHIAQCEHCRDHLAQLAGLWTHLGQMPERVPSPSLERRFSQMLEEHERAAGPGTRAMPAVLTGIGSWLTPFLRPVLVPAMFVVGVIVGLLIQSNKSSEITQLRSEVHGLNRLLTVSLLQQQSASERLKGVSWSLQHPDPEILTVLVNTLRYDPNVNVRLASLDALTHEIDQPSIRKELISALPEQSSPLVQIALVDLLVRLGDSESRGVLKNMLDTPGLNEVVRKRISAGLGHSS